MLLAEIIPTRATSSSDDQSWNLKAALDMDLSSGFTVGVETGHKEVWLELEFGKTHFINRVVVYFIFYTDWFGSGWCWLSVNNFKHCVDQHNNVDVSVYQGEVKQKDCGTIQRTYGFEQSDQIYTLLCNVEGDKVRLSKANGAIWALEIAAIGKGKFSEFVSYRSKSNSL